MPTLEQRMDAVEIACNNLSDEIDSAVISLSSEIDNLKNKQSVYAETVKGLSTAIDDIKNQVAATQTEPKGEEMEKPSDISGQLSEISKIQDELQQALQDTKDRLSIVESDVLALSEDTESETIDGNFVEVIEPGGI